MTPAPLRNACKQLVTERGWLAGTHLENQVSLMLSRCSLPVKPEQQYRAGQYRLDFAWPTVRVALEADGWWHRSPEGSAKDRNRDAWLRSQGWIIFRVDDSYGPLVLEHQIVRVSRIVRAELNSGERWQEPRATGVSLIEGTIKRRAERGQ